MLCHAEGVKGEAASGSNREGESTDAEHRGGAARSSEEGPVMGPERRGCVVQPWPSANWKREEPVDKAKPFKIPSQVDCLRGCNAAILARTAHDVVAAIGLLPATHRARSTHGLVQVRTGCRMKCADLRPKFRKLDVRDSVTPR